jgi:hypothetical protein
MLCDVSTVMGVWKDVWDLLAHLRPMLNMFFDIE